MKNAFDGFISRLDTARERIPELSSIETSQTEKPRGKKKGTD